MNKLVTTKWKAACFSLIALVAFASAPLAAADADSFSIKKIGFVNFKSCVENSKAGKQEQTNFESLKKQAEQTMQQREKELSELASKLQDADYLDSLSKEAEADLKHKYRTMSQELMQQQQQLYQTLSQANFKIIQKLTEEVNKAAKVVAEKNGLDVVVNEEACFYFSSKLDVSNLIVQELDATFEKEAKK